MFMHEAFHGQTIQENGQAMPIWKDLQILYYTYSKDPITYDNWARQKRTDFFIELPLHGVLHPSSPCHNITIDAVCVCISWFSFRFWHIEKDGER